MSGHMWFTVRRVRETGAAYLLEFEDGDEHWIPKSQIGARKFDGDEGRVELT